MNEEAGRVFSIAQDNPPVPGCTTSKLVHQKAGASVLFFSLAAHTDISAEVYDYHKLISVASGSLEVYVGAGHTWQLPSGASFLTPTDIPVGIRTANGCIYMEIEIGKDTSMNEMLEEGTVFRLAELLPYQDGKIINRDLFHNEAMKFVLMSFDADTGLSEHAAPGEALVFALEGEGVIGYEGKDHLIKAGESFAFAKGGKHFVKADQRFKMALLVTLDD